MTYHFSRIGLLLAFLISISQLTMGQDNYSEFCVKNCVNTQYDLGYMASINYERVLGISKNNNPLLISLGISHTLPGYNSYGFNWYGFPLWISRYYGQKRGHFEGGLGYWWSTSYNPKEDNEYNRIEHTYLVRIAYRNQKKKEKGLNYRIGVSLGFYFTFDHDYWYSERTGSIFASVGYSF